MARMHDEMEMAVARLNDVIEFEGLGKCSGLRDKS